EERKSQRDLEMSPNESADKCETTCEERNLHQCLTNVSLVGSEELQVNPLKFCGTEEKIQFFLEGL
ncbi:hypothetical protein BgiBS90_005633, partial [Biomphalaria glabrata]